MICFRQYRTMNVASEKIAGELRLMAEEEQRMRDAGGKDPNEWDTTVDGRNTERMKEIIKEVGWPTISKVGVEVSHLAWLLVQHADHDIEFQKHCLEMMRGMPPGEIQPKDLGYLEDRICVHEGKPQVYGTQFFTDDKTGKFGPRPIGHPENLEERRASLGMQPFVEYEKSLRARWEKLSGVK